MTQLGAIPASDDLATSNHVWPPGTILFFLGVAASVPAGWRVCDGSATTNPSPLYSVVGANVPNLIGRSLAGVDSSFINLLATRGRLDHTHSAAGLTGSNHYHGAGGFYADAGHSHGNGFYMGSHNHNTPVTTADAATKSSGDSNAHGVNYLSSTSTSYNNGGVGGGIHGSPNNLTLSGNSAWTDPGIGGSTAIANPPHTVGLWIIKT